MNVLFLNKIIKIYNLHSARQNVATEEGVRRQETGDRILEENHSCRD
ncbi:MAG: hypothetical protein F6K18_25885 [Okeania sp. SIO2C2]|nr:hypothetical protein [Okeania sp. SIO2C2]NEP89976.1 hypothetical protein [Okeania sp. SIO2C2]